MGVITGLFEAPPIMTTLLQAAWFMEWLD